MTEVRQIVLWLQGLFLHPVFLLFTTNILFVISQLYGSNSSIALNSYLLQGLQFEVEVLSLSPSHTHIYGVDIIIVTFTCQKSDSSEVGLARMTTNPK